MQPPKLGKLGNDGNDGKDGKLGDLNEGGKNGKNGKLGKLGNVGNDGNEGKEGKDGDLNEGGKNGKNGKLGKDGNVGKLGGIYSQADCAAAVRAAEEVSLYTVFVVKFPEELVVSDGIEDPVYGPDTEGVDAYDPLNGLQTEVPV